MSTNSVSLRTVPTHSFPPSLPPPNIRVLLDDPLHLHGFPAARRALRKGVLPTPQLCLPAPPWPPPAGPGRATRTTSCLIILADGLRRIQGGRGGSCSGAVASDDAASANFCGA